MTARDILRVKFLVGLFDHPYQTDFGVRADVQREKAENEEVAPVGFPGIDHR